jgi:hypothetical protein
MRHEGDEAHRTLRISKMTQKVWSVPNFGLPTPDEFDKLRIKYVPEFDDLTLIEQDDFLLLKIGDVRAAELVDALSDINRNLGDYAVSPRIKGASFPIWIWWMLSED